MFKKVSKEQLHIKKPDIPNYKFGRLIAAVRENYTVSPYNPNKYMTQEEFAEALDVNDRTIRRWEAGYPPDKIYPIILIAKLTGIDYQIFIDVMEGYDTQRRLKLEKKLLSNEKLTEEEEEYLYLLKLVEV